MSQGTIVAAVMHAHVGIKSRIMETGNQTLQKGILMHGSTERCAVPVDLKHPANKRMHGAAGSITSQLPLPASKTPQI